MKKAIALIRVSTERQAGDDRASIPAQKAECQKIAVRNYLEIVDTVEVTDVSGAAILMAPEMQELFRRIESPNIHGLVTREFSRLMRPEDPTDFAILSILKRTKTVLYLPGTSLDLNNKVQQFTATLLAGVAGLERQDIKDRVWTAKEAKRRAGLCPSAPMCLPKGVGFDRSTNRWYYKPEAEKVHEAFRRILAGDTSYRRIAIDLGLNRSTMREILQNPIWNGWRVYNKRRDPSSDALVLRPGGRQGYRKKMDRAPDEVIRVKVIQEPLLSDAQWKQAQEIISAKYSRHLRERDDYGHKFVYNGFLVCGSCGEKVYTFTRSRDSVGYYACRSRMAKRIERRCASHYMMASRLEEKLDELLSVKLTDDDFLHKFFEEQERLAKKMGSKAKIARIQDQLAAIDDKRARVLDMYQEGDIDSGEKSNRLEKIDRERRLLQEILVRETPNAMDLSAEELSELFAVFYEWDTWDRETKRRILSTLVPEIKVADYKIHGFYVLPLERNIDPDGDGSHRVRRKPRKRGLSAVGINSVLTGRAAIPTTTPHLSWAMKLVFWLDCPSWK